VSVAQPCAAVYTKQDAKKKSAQQEQNEYMMAALSTIENNVHRVQQTVKKQLVI
jgi:hypothetical protein